jgi:hypothetical protein
MDQLLVILIILFIAVILFCDPTVLVGLFAGVGLYSTISAISKRTMSCTEPFLAGPTLSTYNGDNVDEYNERTPVGNSMVDLETADADNAEIIEDSNMFRKRKNPTKSGDDLISNRATIASSRAKTSIENRSRFTADNMREMYEDELTNESNRDWWGEDDL